MNLNLIYGSILALLISCNNGSSPIEKSDLEVSKKETIQRDSSAKAVSIDEFSSEELSTIEDYLLDFLKRRSRIADKLRTCSQKEANKLYSEYRKLNEINAEKLTLLSTEMLDDMDGLYSSDGGLNLSGRYNNQLKKLLQSGLETWYVGEGMTMIRVRPFEYDHLFSGYLTPDCEEFMQNTLLDDQKLMVNDAGLSISWEELAANINRWENFIQKYPKSTFKKDAKEIYACYQIWYLFGLDNTPVFDYQTNEIYSENKFEFDRFLNYSSQTSTAILVDFLLKTEGATETKRSSIIKKQREILNKM